MLEDIMKSKIINFEHEKLLAYKRKEEKKMKAALNEKKLVFEECTSVGELIKYFCADRIELGKMKAALNNMYILELELCENDDELKNIFADIGMEDDHEAQIYFLEGYMCVRSVSNSGFAYLEDELYCNALREHFLSGDWKRLTGKYDDVDFCEKFAKHLED
jgi:hypothetical protein